MDVESSALVRKCLRGDAAAWTELVRAHHGRVYGLCYRFTGSPQDAEDLTQDIFLKLYGNLSVFNSSKGSLTVWVTTLTRNHLVDHYRRSRLQRSSESLDANWDDSEPDRPGIHLEDTRPGPHAQALQRELEREVQAALAGVSLNCARPSSFAIFRIWTIRRSPSSSMYRKEPSNPASAAAAPNLRAA